MGVEHLQKREREVDAGLVLFLLIDTQVPGSTAYYFELSIYWFGSYASRTQINFTSDDGRSCMPGMQSFPTKIYGVLILLSSYGSAVISVIAIQVYWSFSVSGLFSTCLLLAWLYSIHCVKCRCVYYLVMTWTRLLYIKNIQTAMKRVIPDRPRE